MDLNPMIALNELYNRQTRELAFSARTLDEWKAWRQELSEKLWELLGLDSHLRDSRLDPQSRLDPPRCERVGVVDKGDYVREMVMLEAAPDSIVPMYILTPKEQGQPGQCEPGDGKGVDAGPSTGHGRPVVIALHGHGYGVDDIVGIRKDGSEREAPEGIYKSFAIELVRRGFVVAAPELAGFGRRRRPEDASRSAEASSCRPVAMLALLLGKTLLGMRVFDTMRVIDYMSTLPCVDGSRIGCMGLSGGGMVAMFTSALDQRIGATVISGYLNTFIDSIGSISHCECNYVPGILKYGEMADIAALIAPRPLLAESGTQDRIFPVAATRKALQQISEAYRLLDAQDRLDADIFEGGHEISGAKAYDFMVRWLS